MKEQPHICPLCGRAYDEPPALSRADNQTDICPRCGMMEALAAMPRRETPQDRTRRAVYATGNRWAIENFEAVVAEYALCNQKIFTVHDRYRDFQTSVEKGVNVMKVYVAVAHDAEKLVKAADLILKIYQDSLSNTGHISVFCHDLVCFFRIITYHTEVCELRCIETAEAVNVDLILCKDLCDFLKTSRSVFYEDDILFYHDVISSFPDYFFLLLFFLLFFFYSSMKLIGSESLSGREHFACGCGFPFQGGISHAVFPFQGEHFACGRCEEGKHS